MPEINNESIMTFGLHKGEKIKNVPANYLMWIYKNNRCSEMVRKYVLQNIISLREEIKIIDY